HSVRHPCRSGKGTKPCSGGLRADAAVVHLASRRSRQGHDARAREVGLGVTASEDERDREGALNLLTMDGTRGHAYAPNTVGDAARRAKSVQDAAVRAVRFSAGFVVAVAVGACNAVIGG